MRNPADEIAPVRRWRLPLVGRPRAGWGLSGRFSTLADQVGACAFALRPLHELIRPHVLAAQRLHGDGHAGSGARERSKDRHRAGLGLRARRRTVRQSRPASGAVPLLAHSLRFPPVEHLRGFAGRLQADAYAGFNPLYAPGRVPGAVTECLCWSHRRRKFYELADIAAGKRRGKDAASISPTALEAVQRIDVLFDIDREINGESAERRLAVRRERSALLVAELEA